EEYKEKTIYIVNRYSDNISYKISDIKSALGIKGSDNMVFPINYDVEMVNESNDHSVLNYMLSFSSKQRMPYNQLAAIAEHVLKEYGEKLLLNEDMLNGNQKRKGFFGLPFLSKKGERLENKQ
ncbi:MAG TPA: hypothetical protein DEG71_09745, partial [Clostridiales bacterium]|nr:hypothetical protein [Clostridiales bacterium]